MGSTFAATSRGYQLALAWVILASIVASGGCAMPSEVATVPNVHTVTPGLLVRGGQPDASGLRHLRDTRGIRTVVNFNDETAERDAAVARSLDLNYLAVPSDPARLDDEEILAFLQVVENAETLGPIYVHCHAGQDRTGAAIAAYRIVVLGWDSEQALAELREHQHLLHTLFYGNIPGFVREIEAGRARWQSRLQQAPLPAGLVPAPSESTIPAGSAGEAEAGRGSRRADRPPGAGTATPARG